ncbi:MAG: DUF3025 domain-containing protein [Betaproteobacteria bacterium]|nr:DUF3025 domain-containing protein [Betaproteobacteria bacterium]
MTTPWDPDFAERSPMFDPLRAAARGLRGPYWPGCDDLNRIIASRSVSMVTAGGRPLRFVEQRFPQHAFEDKYEPRIFLRGEVQFRACNWHDLFNALVWLTFPAAKAALNRRHYGELERQRASGAPNRGPAQDALTLFDEGGVIVAAGDAGLAALLTGFQWKELFWRRRAEVVARMRFYLFGHALYEKALAPFVGVTGRGVICEVAGAFFAQPLAQQLRELDAMLAARLGDPVQFLAPRDLAPVPILGVPGWCEDSEREHYYDNLDYFRPAKAAKATAARR